MSFLAFDYGLARIGVAVSEGELATPLQPFQVKDPSEAKKKILSLISLNKVEKIVFGIPNPDSIGAEKFAAELERLVNIPVVRVDEVLTTKIAEAGVKGKKKTSADSLAAAILLQEFLDTQRKQKIAI